MTELSSVSLVERAGRGDAAAFRSLYEEHVRVVFTYAQRRVGYHEAEDVAAEVFAAAWRTLPDYQDSGVPLGAWLLTIARNLIRSRWRRDAVLQIDPTGAPQHSATAATAEHEALRDLTAADLRRALSRLRPAHESVLRLRFLDEFSVRECADVLSTTEENVRVLTFRGLKELRALTGGAFA